jgi:hypothetical protein
VVGLQQGAGSAGQAPKLALGCEQTVGCRREARSWRKHKADWSHSVCQNASGGASRECGEHGRQHGMVEFGHGALYSAAGDMHDSHKLCHSFLPPGDSSFARGGLRHTITGTLRRWLTCAPTLLAHTSPPLSLARERGARRRLQPSHRSFCHRHHRLDDKATRRALLHDNPHTRAHCVDHAAVTAMHQP